MGKGYEDLLATGEATGVQDEDLSKECIAADTLINAIYEAEGRQEEVKSKLKDKSDQENSLNNERDEKKKHEVCSDFAGMIVLNEFAQNDGSLDRQCRSLFAESIIQSSNLFKFLDEKFATNQKDDTVSGGKYLKEDSNSKVESRIEKENKQGGDQEAISIAKEDDKNAFENEGSKIKWEWKALERGDYVEIFEEAVSSEDKEGHTEGSKEDCAELSEETILFVDKEGHSEESKDIKREECTELLEENVMSVEEENHSEDSKDIEKEDCSELHFEDIVSSVDPQTTRDPHVEEIVSAENLQTTRDPHFEEIVSAVNLQTTRDPHVGEIVSAVNLQTTREPHVEEIVSAVNHQITRDTNFEEIVSKYELYKFVEEDITEANAVEIENDIEVDQEGEELCDIPDLSEVEPTTEEAKQEVIEEEIGANAVEIENEVEPPSRSRSSLPQRGSTPS